MSWWSYLLYGLKAKPTRPKVLLYFFSGLRHTFTQGCFLVQENARERYYLNAPFFTEQHLSIKFLNKCVGRRKNIPSMATKIYLLYTVLVNSFVFPPFSGGRLGRCRMRNAAILSVLHLVVPLFYHLNTAWRKVFQIDFSRCLKFFTLSYHDGAWKILLVI